MIQTNSLLTVLVEQLFPFVMLINTVSMESFSLFCFWNPTDIQTMTRPNSLYGSLEHFFGKIASNRARQQTFLVCFCLTFTKIPSATLVETTTIPEALSIAIAQRKHSHFISEPGYSYQQSLPGYNHLLGMHYNNHIQQNNQHLTVRQKDSTDDTTIER